MIMKESKRAQEEIVGFVLIIIIVSVILLVFLSFSLRNSKKMELESYEVEGFIQAFLQYTTDCEDFTGFLSVQDLIFSSAEEICLNEKNAREVLEETLKDICENSWNVGEDTPIKGYELRISSEGEEIFSFNKGDITTQNYKGAVQDFAKRGRNYEISFRAYY